MSKPIIEVRNLSKKYILGERQPYYSLRDTLSSLVTLPFKKDKLQRDEFWALKDVSFEINEGDVVGVIGRNGAGKSTLLKILSQITLPTEGEIKLRGRVASLLEVGTGFHPELTGRENVYLNGAILGMKRWEINKKFNEIVEFAEIEKFLDTPVKHYSSGMYMRLAFSVAAHLEPEILIVDEVLAVGDSQFQKKCLGKMSDVSKQGRTIIFVSHNLSAIESLCTKAMLLSNGKIAVEGSPLTVLNTYKSTDVNETNYINSKKNDICNFQKIVVVGGNSFSPFEVIELHIDFEFYKEEKALLCLMVLDNSGKIYIFSSENDNKVNNGSMNLYKRGKYKKTIKIPSMAFTPGYYSIRVQLDKPFIKILEKSNDIPIIVKDEVQPIGDYWKGKITVMTNPKISFS